MSNFRLKLKLFTSTSVNNFFTVYIHFFSSIRNQINKKPALSLEKLRNF